MTEEAIIDFQDFYPFHHTNSPMTTPKPSPRKIVSLNLEPLPLLRQKIGILKSLEDCQIIALSSSLEQGNHVFLMFEYVERSFEGLLKTGQQHLVPSMKDQIIAFTDKLATYSIYHKLSIKNIGFSSDNKLKYYLGINFMIESCRTTFQLRNLYLRQIEELFDTAFSKRFSRIKQHKDMSFHSSNIIKKRPLIEDKSYKLSSLYRNSAQPGSMTCLHAGSTHSQQPKQKVARESQTAFEYKKKAKFSDLGSKVSKIKENVRDILLGTEKSMNLKEARDKKKTIFKQQNNTVLTPHFRQLKNSSDRLEQQQCQNTLTKEISQQIQQFTHPNQQKDPLQQPSPRKNNKIEDLKTIFKLRNSFQGQTHISESYQSEPLSPISLISNTSFTSYSSPEKYAWSFIFKESSQATAGHLEVGKINPKNEPLEQKKSAKLACLRSTSSNSEGRTTFETIEEKEAGRLQTRVSAAIQHSLEVIGSFTGQGSSFGLPS